MANPAATGRIRFEEFELDVEACTLTRRGEPIKLQQPFDVLHVLLEQPGRLVSREELRKRLWPSDTFVDFDHSLNIAINKIRAALDDSAERPRLIQTVPRRGYRFIGTIQPHPGEKSPTLFQYRRAMAIALGAAIGVAALAAWIVERPSTSPAAAIQSIAVLPLENLSASPADSYLADGITDELTTDLAKISSLRVISHGSALRFREGRTPTPEIARLARARRVDPDAYLAYIKGRAFWNQRTKPALEGGLAAFQQAIDADPTYASAYAGLADCYTALGYGSYLAPKVAFDRAKAAAAKAIALDADLAGPHASLGYAKLYYDWDFRGANLEFQRALALNPNDVTALDWHSVYLTAMGRFDEARAEILRARDLDPLSVATNTDVGFVEYYSGRYAEAVKQLRTTVEMSPLFPLAHLWLGRTYQEQRQYDEAIAEYNLAARVLVNWPVTMAAVGHVYGSSGRRAEAERVLRDLQDLQTREYVTPYAFALVHASLGNREAALDWVDRAVDDRSNWLVWLKLDPRFANLRGSPRFDALVQRVGL